MSQHVWLTLVMLVSSCARPAPVAVCPQVATVDATPVLPPVEPLAIVFVVQGGEIWMGNDDIEPEIDPNDPSGRRPNPVRYSGALKPLVSAIGEADFGSLPAARGALITYADRPVIRVPMGPLRLLDGPAFGTQHDYYGAIGSELVRAVELALDELQTVRARRKFLVVISDGADTNVEAARPRMDTLRNELVAAGITARAFVYKSVLSDPSTLFVDWPGTLTLRNPALLVPELVRLKKRLATSAGRPRCETC